jgi:metallo-beta-lactamase class B
MNLIVKLLLIAIVSITVLGCNDQQQSVFEPKVVYQSDDLVVTQITENAYQHVSYLQTNDFGKVPCNGLIVRDNNEVIIFDTPTNDKSSETLIKWIKETLYCKINAIVPTHFHNDCLGGLKAFEDNGVPSYSYFKTVELAKQNDLVVPQNSFTDSLTLKVGNQKVTAKYFGEGHTIDNVIGYFPAENIMFGGCLIKESDATKGYLGDANVEEWSNTVEKVKEAYPQVKIIIPGHGAYGNQQLLDYTIQLFRN